MPIYQDKRGRYHVAFMQGGRRVHRVCPAGTSKSTAIEFETKLRQEVFKVGRLGKTPEYSIGEAIVRYLNQAPQKWRRDLESKARAIGDHVVGKTLRQAPEVAEAVKKAFQGKLSPATINRRLALLRRVCNLAYKEWGWLEVPISHKIKLLPGEIERTTALNEPAIKRLVKLIQNPQAKAACMIAAYAGLRSAEALTLTKADAKNGVLRVVTGKTNKVRLVPIVPALRPWLTRLPIGLHPSTLSHAVSDAMPGVRFHDLRHSCASLLINAGVDLYTVGKILGHSQPQTTKRYAHLELATLKKAMRKLG